MCACSSVLCLHVHLLHGCQSMCEFVSEAVCAPVTSVVPLWALLCMWLHECVPESITDYAPVCTHLCFCMYECACLNAYVFLDLGVFCVPARRFTCVGMCTCALWVV